MMWAHKVLALFVSCSIYVTVAVRPSETEIKIGNIQAMLYKELNTKILENTGGPDDMHTFVLLNPTNPLIAEHEINKTITGNIIKPLNDDILKKITNELPLNIPLNENSYNDIVIDYGGVSGTYIKIIENSIIKKPKLSPVEQRRYDEANDLMNEKVSDYVIDRTSGEDITKLEVYRHFRSLYFIAKEEKETELENQKNTLNSNDYRRWYMYNYRKLKDNEKSALQDWVIRGHKKDIEEALETVNLETPNVELEEAKNVLEASVYTDQHGQTSYKTELFPSDWQEHLYDDIHDPTPTSSQLLNMILHLREYSIVVQAIGKAHESEATDAQAEVNTEEPGVKAQEAALVDQAVSLIKQLEACQDGSGDCLGIDALAEAQRNDTDKWKDDQTELDDNKRILANSNSIKMAVDNIVNDIGDKIVEYEEKHKNATLQELAIDNDGTAYEVEYHQDFLDDGWTSFHFNSEITFQEYDEQIGMFAKFQPENIDKEFVKILEKRGSQTLALEVDLQYMSVNAYRDWFHGNIFKNQMIKLKDDTLVSPGYVEDLDEVLKNKLSNGEPLYKFPLYPSGLLIAKDIKMKIRGLNEDAGRMLIENSYNPDQLGIQPPEIVPDDDEEEDGSPYHHIGSIFGFGYKNIDSHAIRFRVKQDFNDVDIELLEPHLIGQFCDIISKFPQ